MYAVLSKEGSYVVSKSLLEIRVKAAMRAVIWNESAFHERGGVYEWKKKEVNLYDF